MKKTAICSAVITLLAGSYLVTGCNNDAGIMTPQPPAAANNNNRANGNAAPVIFNGVVQAPADQIALLPRQRILEAMATGFDLFGTPAHAADKITRKPLGNAVVTIHVRSTGQSVVGPVNTGADGVFHISVPSNVPQSSGLEIDALSQDGNLELKAAIGVKGNSQMAVDEISTVAADAAEQTEQSGGSPQEGDTAAQETAKDQETAEISSSDNVPDCRKKAKADKGPGQMAQVHLASHFIEKVDAFEDHSHKGPTLKQTILAALAYLKSNGVSANLADHYWVAALGSGPATYTDVKVVDALTKAGVVGVTAAQVDSALKTLNNTLVTKFTPDKIPAAVVVILVGQIGAKDQPNPLELTTSNSLDLVVSALTGTPIPQPAQVTGGATTNGASTTTGAQTAVAAASTPAPTNTGATTAAPVSTTGAPTVQATTGANATAATTGRIPGTATGSVSTSEATRIQSPPPPPAIPAAL